MARNQTAPNTAATTARMPALFWGRAGRWGLSFTLGATVLLALGYFTPRRVKPSSDACAVTIYVSGDRFHTSVTVPVKTANFNWYQQLNRADLGQKQQSNGGYLNFSWGDRRFYLTTPSLQELKLSTTLRALFLPTDTVMYVQGTSQRPQSLGSYQVQSVRLSHSGYEQLTTHLAKSFARGTNALPVLLEQNPYETGTFYAGTGRYGFWQTCNDWLAQGLRVAEVQTPLWSGLAGSVFRHLSASCSDE